VHHNAVAFAFHALEQFTHPAIAHAHPFRRLALRDPPVFSLFQPIQLISFLLAHRDSFHPSALRLSRGTFYFGHLGNFHFGATLQMTGHIADFPVL
jgi:hypothetical protein